VFGAAGGDLFGDEREEVRGAVLPMLDADGRFRLGDGVTTDWVRFRQTLAESLTLDGEERVDRLRAALALVRDRPFRGIGAGEYAWADHDIQQMTAAIADAAHLLARLHQEAGRHREALDAATHGLMAEPYSEPLQDLAVSATRALAGPDEARTLRRRYAAALARLDPELA